VSKKDKLIIGMTPLVDRTAEQIMMLNTYTQSILDVGGIPMVLPLTEEEQDIEQILKVCHGFVFTGGHDVEPRLYGEEKLDCVDPCKERDNFEMKLLPKVIAADKPVLAICRGMQLLNVALGGSLYQDIPTQLPSQIQHRMSPASDKVIHEISVVDGTPLMKIVRKNGIMINSYHHQCVKKLGDGLEVMAYAPDGIIEGIYMPEKKFVVAVQWHPERIYKKYEDSKKILEAFIKAID